jgi:hypothetical protein
LFDLAFIRNRRWCTHLLTKTDALLQTDNVSRDTHSRRASISLTRKTDALQRFYLPPNAVYVCANSAPVAQPDRATDF